MILSLRVRFTGSQENQQEYQNLLLDVSKTALLLVDCTFENPPESGVGQVLRKIIAPTLEAVRAIGL